METRNAHVSAAEGWVHRRARQRELRVRGTWRRWLRGVATSSSRSRELEGTKMRCSTSSSSQARARLHSVSFHSVHTGSTRATWHPSVPLKADSYRPPPEFAIWSEACPRHRAQGSSSSHSGDQATPVTPPTSHRSIRTHRNIFSACTVTPLPQKENTQIWQA